MITIESIQSITVLSMCLFLCVFFLCDGLHVKARQQIHTFRIPNTIRKEVLIIICIHFYAIMQRSRCMKKKTPNQQKYSLKQSKKEVVEEKLTVEIVAVYLDSLSMHDPFFSLSLFFEPIFHVLNVATAAAAVDIDR